MSCVRVRRLSILRRSFSAAALSLLFATGSTGCMSKEAAGSCDGRTTQAPEFVWPAGDSQCAKELAAMLPDRIARYDFTSHDKSANEPPAALNYTLIVEEKHVVAGSVLLKASYDPEVPPPPHADPNFPLFYRVITPPADWRDQIAKSKTEIRNGVPFREQTGLFDLIMGNKYGLLPAPETAAIGTVIWFGGISQSWRLEQETIAELSRRGFAVISPRNSGLNRFVGQRVYLQDLPKDKEGQQELFVRRITQTFRPGVTRVAYYEDAEQAGIDLAIDINEQILATASAAGPMLEFAQERQPSLRNKPVLVVGCSGGAPAALAFVSKYVDRVAGVILIGAGQDLPQMLLRTDLNAGKEVIHWRNDTPLPDQERQFFQAFCETSTVDPLKTGLSIPTDRVLMIQARFDSVVPTDLQSGLWETLGRPERWQFFGGHRLLFWRLDAYANDIADWAAAKAKAASIAPLANASHVPLRHAN